MNAVRRKKKNKVVVCVFMGGAFFALFHGCIPMAGWRIVFDGRDVNLISGYRRGEWYVLRQDVFIVKSRAYAIGMLGVAVPEKYKLQGSYYAVPQTIEDWEPPKDGAHFGYNAFSDIRGVMPKGAKIEIVGSKVVYAVSWWYGFEKVLYIMAQGMLNGRRIEFEISDLTDRKTRRPFETLISRDQVGHRENIR